MSNPFLTPWTVAHQAPLSMVSAKQECWSGLGFPSPGDLPNQGIEPASPVLAGRFFIAEPAGNVWKSSFKTSQSVKIPVGIGWGYAEIPSPWFPTVVDRLVQDHLEGHVWVWKSLRSTGPRDKLIIEFLISLFQDHQKVVL